MSVCHFLNKLRTSDTCEPACDSEGCFFSTAHVWDTEVVQIFMRNTQEMRILWWIQPPVTGDWTAGILASSSHKSCLSKVQKCGEEHLCTLPLTASFTLLFTHARDSGSPRRPPPRCASEERGLRVTAVRAGRGGAGAVRGGRGKARERGGRGTGGMRSCGKRRWRQGWSAWEREGVGQRLQHVRITDFCISEVKGSLLGLCRIGHLAHTVPLLEGWG